MSKTYRRDKPFRPKKQGRIFTKDHSWKKNRKQKLDTCPIPDSEIYIEPPTEP